MKFPLHSAILPAALLCGEARAAVRYVDAARAGSHDEAEGGADHTYRTPSYAMKKLRPGGTLNIAGGVYRESLQFPELDWGEGTTVIQAEDSSNALIKGSDAVSGWIPAERRLHVCQIAVKDKAERGPPPNRLNGKIATVLTAGRPGADRSSLGPHR